jgi:TPR repeat protein
VEYWTKVPLRDGELARTASPVEVGILIACLVRRHYLSFMFKWIRRAAPQIDLGPGRAGRNDDDEIKWFRKAAEKGTAWGQFNLGVSYDRGQGVPQDYTEAVKWFLKAAEQGEAMSQYNLGRMYEESLGVAADFVESRELSLTALRSNTVALLKLAECVRSLPM